MKDGALFHFRPMVCLALGLCAGIALHRSLFGTGRAFVLCLFFVYLAAVLYLKLPGYALFAAAGIIGLLRPAFAPMQLPAGFMAPFQYTRAKLLEAAAQIFGKYAPVLQAMLWGFKDDIPDTLYGAYRGSGIAHVLALSGLHVSFMSGVIYRFTRGRRPRTRFYSAAALLFSYCAIAAFPASLVRASVMSLCFLYAAVCGRRYDMLSGLAFAAVIILLVDPVELFGIGFQLSFCAAAAIALLMGKVSELFSFLPDSIADLISVSLCGTLGTLPLSVYYFHAVPLLGLFANALILPLVPAAFISAMAVNLLCLVLPAAAVPLAAVPAYLIRVITGAAAAVASVSPVVSGAHITPMACAFIYLAYICASDYPLIKKKYAYAACASMFAGALLCML